MSEQDYLDSYARTDIHAEMLHDRERTMSYRRALLDLDLEGKAVLDVGCGTGILSMFAVQSGARHVYAVEASDLAPVTRQIIADNGMSDRITVLHGKMEELELPEKVDVIVSEWMGYFLIFERMLDSVLVARDRWLKPGGILLPGTATLTLAAGEDFEFHSQRLQTWEDVYGFDLSAIVPRRRSEAVVESIDSEAIATDIVPVLELDIATMDVAEQDFTSAVTLQVERTDTLHVIVASFDVDFDVPTGRLVLPTDPFAPDTHWKQTLFYFDRGLEVKRGDRLHVRMSAKQNPKSPRSIDVELHVSCNGEERTGTYRV